MSDQADILAVNERFYAAFRDRDLEAMDEVLAEEHVVAVIHPGWRALSGREAVLASWKALFRNPRSPEVHAQNPQVLLMGDSAMVICTELLPEGTLAATNIFVREGASWRMTHHHAGPGEGILPDPDEEPGAVFH